MLKAIHAQENREAAREKAVLAAAKLRQMKLDRIAEFVETSVDETLSYMDFPYEHWSRLRTNNGLKRIMKEICRRTRIVGSFPFPSRRTSIEYCIENSVFSSGNSANPPAAAAGKADCHHRGGCGLFS